MRILKSLLLIACTCGFVAGAHAQSLDKQSGSSAGKPEKTGEKKNIIKLNLMALPLKNFSFQYERF